MIMVSMQILIVSLCIIVVIRCDNCHDDPVFINEDFLVCCKGKPRYTSENCIDTLLEQSKFSPECVVDCMYREFKIYDGKIIDLSEVTQFLSSQVTNKDFNLVYTNAFERCSKLEKSELKKLFSFVNITSTYDCDVYPDYVETCVWYYTLANCPDTYATHDESCSDKREWVKECLLKG